MRVIDADGHVEENEITFSDKYFDPAFRSQRPGGVDGAVLGPDAFVLRFFGATPGEADDRLLIVNLGRDLHLSPAPEPLLAPVGRRRWETQWSSEDPRYGGGGTPAVDTRKDNWHVPGNAAVVLASAESVAE